MEILYRESIPSVPSGPLILLTGLLIIILGVLILFRDLDCIRKEAYGIIFIGGFLAASACLNRYDVDIERLYVAISSADPQEESVKWEAAGWELVEAKGKLYILERRVEGE